MWMVVDIGKMRRTRRLLLERMPRWLHVIISPWGKLAVGIIQVMTAMDIYNTRGEILRLFLKFLLQKNVASIVGEKYFAVYVGFTYNNFAVNNAQILNSYLQFIH